MPAILLFLTKDQIHTHTHTQGEDGKKFKTRSGDTVKLRDLLDEAGVDTFHVSLDVSRCS